MATAGAEQPRVEIATIRTALARLLLGGVFVVVDLTIEGFDILNDTIGFALLYMSLDVLQGAVPYSYRGRMVLAKVITGLMVVWSIALQIEPRFTTSAVNRISDVAQFVVLLSICTSMQGFARSLGLTVSEASWRLTLNLVVILHGGGLAGLFVVDLLLDGHRALEATPEKVSILLLVVGAILVPLVHLAISVVRMRREMVVVTSGEAVAWRPNSLRLTTFLAVVMAAITGSALWALASGNDSGSEWQAMFPGQEVVPLAEEVVDGQPWYFGASKEPNRDSLRKLQAESVCIRYRVPDSSGGHCFVAGWAVEASTIVAGSHEAIFGIAIPEARDIQIPTRSGGLRTLSTTALPGFKSRFFFEILPAGTLSDSPNEIVALDDRGRLLGRQHWNVSETRKPDFGAYDGLYDRKQRHRPGD